MNEEKRMNLEKKIAGLEYLGDRYDPRYNGPERSVIPPEVIAERAKYALRNKKIIIGGSHTAPLQAFALRECRAKMNQSGRSVTVEVAALLEKFPKGNEYYAGTNRHNHVTFSDVYRAIMARQPWEK